MKYKPFEVLVTRVPLLPYGCRCKYDFEDPQFNEALYVASPELYEQKQRQNKEYTPQMKKTLYKYWSRAATRSTPFGLFSSWGVANIGKENAVSLLPRSCIIRHDRLDMSLLCRLIKYLESVPAISCRIKYYPNDSLVRLGGKYRYIEYQYTNENRHYFLQEVDRSDVLEKIINCGRTGLSLFEATSLIVSEDVDKEMAEQYVLKLIQNQILVSELEVDVCCENPLNDLISKLRAIQAPVQYISALAGVDSELMTVLESFRHDESAYETLIKHLNPMIPNINRKHFLQTNTSRSCSFSSISQAIIDDVCDVISSLSSLSEGTSQDHLQTFISRFSDKFEGEKIPLLIALDYECGVGYPCIASYGPIDPLIEGLPFSKNKPEAHETISSFEAFILRQMIIHGKNKEISIDDYVSKDADPSDAKRPSTITALFQINRGPDGKTRLILNAYGGASASSLIGRAAYFDKTIDALFSSVCDYEQGMIGEGEILAEIVHLPQDRVGNVICRSSKREAEIHFLSHAATSKKIQILKADDLELSYDQERLRLTLKSDGREVIPILSNTHNYSQQNLPAYHFLCDYQYYAMGRFPGIGTSNVLRLFDYAPRIVYKNVILSLRKWRVSDSEISSCPTGEDIAMWRERFEIPHEIVICDFDNELYINFEDALSTSVFVETLRQKKSLVIKEIYGEPEAVFLDGNNEVYRGEIALSLYREK